jgi:hypothetical protein
MRSILPRFALTIFLSAFLLFQVEPIAARFLVPWFGGSSAVWTTCLVFFQIALLLGYLYAHGLIRRARPRMQAVIHLSLLGVSALVAVALHLTPLAAWKPAGGGDPTGRILGLLALTVGLPFLTLATTGPLLQAWYAEAAARRGVTEAYPYRLYSLSNLGSMLALLSYPTLVEPLLPLHVQAWLWAGGFVVFALVCGSLAAPLLRGGDATAAGDLSAVEMTALETGAPPAPKRSLYAAWVVLSAIPAAMLLAVTSHVTQNVAAVPFLWVLPLALYLLTFILVFGVKQWRWNKGFLPIPTLACMLMAYALSSGNENMVVAVLLPIWLCGLFVGCLICHGELARLKPAAQYLTGYYLTTSVGGALGGLFVALLAPRLFPANFELPITVAAVGLVSLFALYRDPGEKWWEPSWLAACVLCGGLIFYLGRESSRRSRARASRCATSMAPFRSAIREAAWTVTRSFAR